MYFCFITPCSYDYACSTSYIVNYCLAHCVICILFMAKSYLEDPCFKIGFFFWHWLFSRKVIQVPWLGILEHPSPWHCWGYVRVGAIRVANILTPLLNLQVFPGMIHNSKCRKGTHPTPQKRRLEFWTSIPWKICCITCLLQ